MRGDICVPDSLGSSRVQADVRSVETRRMLERFIPPVVEDARAGLGALPYEVQLGVSKYRQIYKMSTFLLTPGSSAIHYQRKTVEPILNGGVQCGITWTDARS